jgi:hypothetical protein
MRFTSVLLACALVFGAGACAHHEQAAAAVPRVAASPWPPNDFSDAVAALTSQLELLRVIPPAESERGLLEALDRLAGAIERVPEPRGVAVNEAAKLIRADLQGLEYGSALQEDHTERVKRALLTAVGALELLARGPYRDAPGLATRVQAFRDAVTPLDAQQPLSSQRGQVLTALAQADTALHSVLTTVASRPKRQARR